MASSRWPSVPSSLSSSAPEGHGTSSGAHLEDTSLITPGGVKERESDAIPNFFHTRLWGAQGEGAAKPELPTDEAVLAAVRAITHGSGPSKTVDAKNKAPAVAPDAESSANVNVGPQTPPRANSRQRHSSTTPVSMEKTAVPQQPLVKKRPASIVPEEDLREEAEEKAKATTTLRTHLAETPSKRPRPSESAEAKPQSTAIVAAPKQAAAKRPQVKASAADGERAAHKQAAAKRPPVKQDKQLVLATLSGTEKVRASPKRRFDLRGLALTEVPADAFEGGQNGLIGGRWPRRLRMQPLDEWRNERIIYERLPGSPTPSIKGAVLNCSPRPQNAGERPLPVRMISLATPLEDAPSEVIGTSTQQSHCKVITLPPWNRDKTKRPFVQVLDTSELQGARHITGVLKVLEGALRMTVEGPGAKDYEEADLGLHSTVVLPSCGKFKVLVTATSSSGARLWWNVTRESRARPLALPLSTTTAQSEQVLQQVGTDLN